MQLVGYSNFPKDFIIECNIMCKNIWGGNIGQEVCTKKGKYVLPCCCKGSGDTSKIFAALQLLDLPKHNNNGRNTIK